MSPSRLFLLSPSTKRLTCVGVLVSLSGVLALAACVGDDPILSGPQAVDDGGVDAGADDAGGGDASPSPSFCETYAAAHDFCADFDDVARVADGWSVSEVRGDAEPPAFADVASSPPRSMRSTVHATPDGGTDVPISRLSHQRPLPVAGQHPALHVEAAVYVDAADGQNVFVAGFDSPALALFLRAIPNDAGAPTQAEVLVVQGAAGITAVIDRPVPWRTWTRLALTVTPRAAGDGGEAGGGFTVEVGDVVKTFSLPSQPVAATFRADIGLGVTAYTGGEWSVLFDDVLIDGAR